MLPRTNNHYEGLKMNKIPYKLTDAQRQQYITELSEDQRQFLNNLRRQTIQNTFNNHLRQKNARLRLIDYQCDKRDRPVSGELRCDYCERRLRHQYIIKNIETKAIQKLGTDHFTTHLGISKTVAVQLASRLRYFDLEIDELLYKVHYKQYPTMTQVNWVKQHLFNFPIWRDVLQFSDHHLPWLDSWVAAVSKMASGLNDQSDNTLKFRYVIHSIEVQPQAIRNQYINWALKNGRKFVTPLLNHYMKTWFRSRYITTHEAALIPLYLHQHRPGDLFTALELTKWIAKVTSEKEHYLENFERLQSIIKPILEVMINKGWITQASTSNFIITTIEFEQLPDLETAA